MARLHLSDERGFVVSFFVKLAITLLILGIASADGASIFFANLRADDAASAGASACASSFKVNKNFDAASAAAVEAAHEKAPGVTVVEVAPNPQTGECTVGTRSSAATLVVQRIGFLKKYGEATASETAPAPTF